LQFATSRNLLAAEEVDNSVFVVVGNLDIEVVVAMPCRIVVLPRAAR